MIWFLLPSYSLSLPSIASFLIPFSVLSRQRRAVGGLLLTVPEVKRAHAHMDSRIKLAANMCTHTFMAKWLLSLYV